MSWRVIEPMQWPTTLGWVLSRNGVLAAAACVLGLAACSRLIRRKPTDTYKRGVVLTDGRSEQRRSARRRRAGSESLTLAGVPVAAADETKHFKLLGTTGTGKSTAIRELLGAAIARGDRAVFADSADSMNAIGETSC
jgi:Type IV secretion-system coupling protein DNA-binding domain